MKTLVKTLTCVRDKSCSKWFLMKVLLKSPTFFLPITECDSSEAGMLHRCIIKYFVEITDRLNASFHGKIDPQHFQLNLHLFNVK